MDSMENAQFCPLEVNPNTGEPFLRLRSHKNIILTPPRPEDALSYIPNMNDPRVYEWLGSPPFPFLLEHAEAMYEKFKVIWDFCQAELEAARESPELVLVGNCPVRAIREVLEDGSDVFLGDIGITRAKDGKLLAPPDETDDENAARYVEINMSLPAGDPNITWSVGVYDTGEYDMVVNYLQDMFRVLTTDDNVSRWEEYGICNDVIYPSQNDLDSRNLVGPWRIATILRYTYPLRLGEALEPLEVCWETTKINHPEILEDTDPVLRIYLATAREQRGGEFDYDTETVKMLGPKIIYHPRLGPRNFVLALCTLARLYRRLGRAQEAHEMLVKTLAQKVNMCKYQLTPFEFLQNVDTDTRSRMNACLGYDPFEGIVNIKRDMAVDTNVGVLFGMEVKPAFCTNMKTLKVAMRSFYKLAAIVLLAPLAFAAPLKELELVKRQIDTSTHCGQWDSVTAGQYTLFLDQWGLSGASSGSDCASITSLSGTTIAWKNTWTWVGGTGVKSYTNVALNSGLNKRLSDISSIPSSSGTVVADVAYDLFTSSSSGGSAQNEIMIWLANYNAGPISAVYNSDGTPQPKASNVSLGGRTWSVTPVLSLAFTDNMRSSLQRNLYFGSNGVNNVYSFLPTGNAIVTSFNADINVFIKGLSSSQFLTTLEVGTEATSGSAYSSVID
ncbi:hypothetical protein C0995_012498 [Termitomyces sp. Mi166|nr:hypothetical protein C0995_012498 [Termitomyces sp. Mi166\